MVKKPKKINIKENLYLLSYLTYISKYIVIDVMYNVMLIYSYGCNVQSKIVWKSFIDAYT